MTAVIPSLCSKKCSLTLDHTKCSEAGTYAILFDGSGDTSSFGTRLPDDLFANCQSDGGDICFTSDSAGTTQLAVELVAISTSGKTCEIWVPISLSISVDAVIYVWYKSSAGTLTQPSAAATYGSQAVWSTVGNMLFVWHGGTSSSLSVVESTGNATGTNHSATAVAGEIGGGAALTTAQYVDFGNPANLLNWDYNKAWTMSMWLKYTASGTGNFFSKQLNSGTFAGVGFNTQNSNKVEAFVYAGVSSVIVDWPTADNDGTLRKYDLSYNGAGTAAGCSGYANGSVKSLTTIGSPVSATVATAASLQINGRAGANGTFAIQAIDECRIRSTNDSANRVSTDYAIQSSSSLVTVGTPVSASTARAMFYFINSCGMAG